MSEPVSLLPHNATPLETALELTAAVQRPLPDDMARLFWNPDTCPEHLLGWLALQLSVDVWDEGWSVERKRHVIKRSIPLHQIKGTEAALREYIALAGYEVLKVVTPPKGIFASRGMDTSQHQEWLQSLPEIRLFKLRPRGRGNNAAPYANGTRAIRGMFAGSGAPGSYVGIVAGDPFDLQHVTRREAVLIENGVETVLGIDGRGSQEVETFYIPRPPSRTTNASGRSIGGFAGRGFAAREDERPDYVATIRRSGDVVWWNLARHGRQPVDANPTIGKTTGQDRVGAFAGRFAGHVFATRGDNERLVYESWRISGLGTVPALAQPVSFVGHARTSIDPYTAEVTVDMRRRAPIGWAFAGLPRAAHFATRADSKQLEPLKRSIAASKAARDRVLIDTQSAPPRTFAASTINDLI